MKESTAKLLKELLEHEIKITGKWIYTSEANMIIAEAEKNNSAFEIHQRSKNCALKRLEELQDALNDLN